jgi:hypothetical protein
VPEAATATAIAAMDSNLFIMYLSSLFSNLESFCGLSVLCVSLTSGLSN